MIEKDYNKKILDRFLLDYVVPNWKKLLKAIMCTIVSSVCTVAVAYLVKPIIDDIFVDKNIYALSGVAIGFFTVSLLRGAGDYFEAILLNNLWQEIVQSFQIRGFSHLIKADLSFFHSATCGDLVSKLTNDISVMKTVITTAISSLCKDIFVVIGILALVFYRDPYFSIVAIIGFSATVLPTLKVGKKVRKISSTTQQEFSEWVSFLTQSFQGIRMVKSYNMENFEEERAKKIAKNIFDLSVKSAKTKAIIHPTIEFLSGIAVSLIVFVGGWLVIKGYRTPGTLLSFLTAIIMIYRPVKSLANSNSLLQEGLAAVSRIYGIIDMEPQIKNVPNARKIDVSKTDIEFKNVNFSYENKKENVLSNIDLFIPNGKSLALVGHSGSGKSTLINLLLRFYDIENGKILINNQDIKNVTIESLRGSISLVSQDIVLFNDTVANNIAFGKMNASMKEIKEAAKFAEALDFIESLPEKFNTKIGDNGALLSGGQKQRISIARAILKNAPILLLDEATSALDTESERKIQEALVELMKGKTSIIIAHRLSTIVNADKIIVLEKGRVIEAGTHDELLAKNGEYSKFYSTQNFST